MAVELIARWDARSAFFVGLEQEAGRYVPVLEAAQISTQVITPEGSAQAILSILARAIGLEEAAVAAKDGFGRFLDDLSVLSGQA